ncbi:putative peptidase [Escherichia coli]|nr:putative peptidase [Escherichia coli]
MAKNIPFKLILEKAKDYQADMTRFLRDMVAIPSESCDEKRVVHRIKEEMEKVGFDKVEIDPMGNVLGYIGHGPRLVAMDAHIDTVGIGNIKNWDFDPYEGMETDELIGGRGTSDQEGGMASMVYAGKIIKDLGLEDEYTLLVTGTVQEEDCDGLCWQYIIEQSGIRPEFVVSTEPTDCQVYRGQRGRMEIRIDVRVLAATVLRQNAVTTPFSKWVRFLANYKNSPNVWVMTNSSAKAPSPFLKSSSHPQAVAL